MTEKKLYLALQSVLCILLVILMAAAAASIYREGRARKAENPMEWIYTREAVGDKFKSIAPLFFGAIGFTAAGWILAVRDENADKPVKDAGLARDLTVSRVAVPDGQMKEEQRKQKRIFRAGWFCFLLCMVPVGIYLSNGGHFPDGNLEKMIASLALHIFPWIILGLGCLMVSAVLQEKSILRETEAARLRIKEENASGIKPEAKADGDRKDLKAKSVLQLVVVAVAVVFLILGVCNGSAKAVYTKAANICTECVGLG